MPTKLIRKGALVLVEWEDSAQPSSSWQFLEDVGAPPAVRCRSVGWLIANTEDVRVLAPNMGAVGGDAPQVSGVITIPSRAVLRMVLLREPD